MYTHTASGWLNDDSAAPLSPDSHLSSSQTDPTASANVTVVANWPDLTRSIVPAFRTSVASLSGTGPPSMASCPIPHFHSSLPPSPHALTHPITLLFCLFALHRPPLLRQVILRHLKCGLKVMSAAPDRLHLSPYWQHRFLYFPLALLLVFFLGYLSECLITSVVMVAM